MRRLRLVLLVLLAAALILPVAGFFAARFWYERDLPSVESLRELKLQVPLRVYTADGLLIGEFGAERRAPLRYAQIPPAVIDAFLAAEDDRFFEHPGVDWQGLLRASIQLALTGEKAQGGSTITMQLARNVFLTPERSFSRKFREIFLALKIERELSKELILETYLNKIFLGQRAYGVGAAAQVYFGKPLDQLSIAQAALLAGLPKAPSRDNPVASPERARERRDYVLRRLREIGKLSELELQAALAEPLVVTLSLPEVEVDAHYVAEMVRAELVAARGEAAYTDGLRVITTLDSRRQRAANAALRAALTAYDERHGWRGAETRLPETLLREGQAPADGEDVQAFLGARPPVAGLLPAAVVSFDPARLTVLALGQGLLELPAAAFKWAGLGPKKPLTPGDVVRVRRDGERWVLAQVPEAQGALVAIDPRDGRLQALAGGYDFLQNKYNRVIQAQRQAGSGFKPFLYAAAFEFGFNPASVLLDAPVVFDEGQMGSAWRPENYGGDYKGPTRLREALVFSRNLVSVRLLQAIGLDHTIEAVARYGLPRERLPRDLSISLGSASFTPLEMARAYSVLANGGFLVTPTFIERIEDGRGGVSFSARPPEACEACEQRIIDSSGALEPPVTTAPSGAPLAPRVMPAPVAWMVHDILREVTVRGTAAKARELRRGDLAGKTGTTNDETDAWFYGYTPALVAVSWVGFDQPQPLGRGEVGGRAALPMWMDFMEVALEGLPEAPRSRPPGLVAVRVDPASGRLARAGQEGLFEYIPAEQIERLGELGEGARVSPDAEAADLQELF
ncbi:MAG TPA: PBP1A family penicillin-binding protein [Nevskiaceae bacterium]|nr:PBP1A family penicillin-binding protein [Nevskiaceae bacterium]